MSTSKSGRRDSHGQYRGVQVICAGLGYDSNDKNKPRSYPELRDTVIRYRKDYVQEQSELRQTEFRFPTSYQVQDAQDCAARFVREHPDLFEATSEALDAGWLTLPDDAEDIKIDITKMMCIQAKKFYEKPRKSNNVHDRSESPESFAGSLTASYDESKVKRQISESIYDADNVEIPLSPYAIEDDSDEGDPESQLQSQPQSQIDPEPRSIEDFLESAYPSHDVAIGTENRWVFEPKSYWPDNLKAFAYRWVLEKKAFVLRKRSSNLRDFVKILKKQIGLVGDLDQEEEERLSSKSQKFLSSWVAKWKSDEHRVLQEVNEQVSLHPIVHSAWVKRKWDWVAKQNRKQREGSPKGVYQAPTKEKRAYDDVESDMQLGEASDHDTIKKPRHQHTGSHDGMEGVSYSNSFPPRQSAPIVRRTFSEMLYNNNHNSTSNSHFAAPPNATRAASSMRESSVRPVPDLPPIRNRQPTRESTIIGGDNATRPRYFHNSERSAANSPGRAPEEFNNIHVSSPATSRVPSPQTLQRPTAPWQSNPPSLTVNDQPYIPQPLTIGIQQPPRLNPPTTPSEKPITLLFLAEKGRGALNSAHPISLQEFLHDNLETFFTRVSSRRHSQPIGQVWSHLRFTQKWGDREVFLVGKDADEDAWEAVKTEIGDNYEYARDTMPEIRVFKVWVKCEFEEGKLIY